jgi:hypothetical protein
MEYKEAYEKSQILWTLDEKNNIVGLPHEKFNTPIFYKFTHLEDGRSCLSCVLDNKTETSVAMFPRDNEPSSPNYKFSLAKNHLIMQLMDGKL